MTRSSNKRIDRCLARGYFPFEQITEYILGDEESFELKLRNDIPLSEWRRFTVTQGGGFAGENVRFLAKPANTQDVYFLYGENLDMLGFDLGKEGATFPLDAGIYYLAFNPAVDSPGEKVLTSEIVH